MAVARELVGLCGSQAVPLLTWFSGRGILAEGTENVIWGAPRLRYRVALRMMFRT